LINYLFGLVDLWKLGKSLRGWVVVIVQIRIWVPWGDPPSVRVVISRKVMVIVRIAIGIGP
jgi:hypothetical protein